MIFLHAPRVVVQGVVLNEVYLTGICVSAIYVVFRQTYIVKDILDSDGSTVRTGY
jgi:hypothetical protein